MKITLLHTQDALEEPVDAVLAQLQESLSRLGHESTLLVVDDQVQPVVTALAQSPPELVFNLCESFAGRSALESSIAALLNLLGLRYTGSSPAGLVVAGDKTLTKKVLSFHGITTPRFATVFRGAVDWAGDIDFPLIVKPPQEDASLGITGKSVVRDVKELLDTMSSLQEEYKSAVLVEQFIEGREFYVGVLGNASPEALPVIELDFSGFPGDKPRIASWAAKWGDDGDESGAEFAGTKSVFPTDVSEELMERMQQVAVDSFNALRLRDYARIDLRVTDAGDIYVIEANPNCYLEAKSEFARAATRAGLQYDQLIGKIIELSTARYSR